MTSCPCGSGKDLSICCGPHLERDDAPTAEALMRSRYTAYALGRLDYIERTAAGEARLAFDRTAAARSMAGTQWLGLTIAATQAGGVSDDAGTVTFTARYRENGRLGALSERSTFRRIDGRWRYVRGEVAAPAAEAGAARPPGRNDACPCGSGLKFKKCCGAAA